MPVPIPPPSQPVTTGDKFTQPWVDAVGRMAGAVLPQIYTWRYEPTFVSSISRVDNETQVTGVSMKYSEWWKTTYAVHHWEKPTNPYFRGISVEIAGGGGGGGNARTTAALSGVGSGGCGGGWAIKKGGLGAQYWDKADIPDELVFVVGHGGEGGGWTTADSTTPSVVNGKDGGLTAVVASSVWDSLSTVSDAARLTALVALNSTQLTTTCIMWADGGGGGQAAQTTPEFAESDGARTTASVPPGARAYGGDFNGLGSAGTGGGYLSFSSGDLNSEHQPFGHGGACGKIYDALWGPMMWSGSGGAFMSLAGQGAPRSGGSGAHIGSEGGLYGGGGNGGIIITPATTRRRGGWGGWGAAEVKEFYRPEST